MKCLSLLVAALLIAVSVTAVTVTVAEAQGYSRLQVLLPGENPAPGTIGGRTGVPSPQTVGVPFQVRVRACETFWSTVTSVTNVIELTSSDASAVLPGPTALTNGEALLTVTLNAAGSFRISATDLSDPTIPSVESSVVTTSLLQGFRFSAIHKHQSAGIPLSITITAIDPSGFPVEGFSGPVRLKEITSFGDGRISPEVVTFAGGTWTGWVSLYRADESFISRGNVNILAYLEASPAKNGTSDPFIVHPGPFARLQLIVPGQSPAPGSLTGLTGSPASQGSGQNFSVHVYSTDAYWNAVPSADVVRITSNDPLATTPVSGGLSSGHREFIIALGTVGSRTLTVVDQTSGSITGMTCSPITVTSSVSDHFMIEPIASPIVAGDSVLVTIHATDAAGNPIPDYSGNAILIAVTGPGSISPEGIVFANGEWTGYITFRGAGGAVSFSCSDFASPPHTGTSDDFEVLAGPYVGLQVLLPGQTPRGGTATGFSGTPTPQNAGNDFNVTFRAVDAFWNRVSTVSDRIALTSSDPFGAMPADTTLTNGELLLAVTLFKGGSQTITATSLDTPAALPYTSSSVAVVPGSYSRILLLLPGQSLAPGTVDGRTGNAIDQSISFGFRGDVFATDDWWNPVGEVTDVVHITSSDALAQLPADSAMVDGHVAMNLRLSTGGYQTITASNVSSPSMTPSTTQVRMISTGFHLEAEVAPVDVQAGEPFTLTVRVTNDAGSVITEVNSIVEIEVRHAATSAPGRGLLATTRFQLLNGERSISENYTFAEPIVLIARDDAGNEPAVSPAITVRPGAAAAIELSSDPPWVRALRHATFRARVKDAYENGVPDAPITFAVVNGEGTVTAIDSVTTADGVALADFLSPRVAQVTRLRAASSSLVAELDVETALVDPTLPGGTVTNYPNPFHPGETPTTIAWKLAADARVELSVYTLSGNLVLRESFPAGSSGGSLGLNEFRWDGRNGDGDVVSSGGYLVHVRAEGAGETLHEMRRKIAVVR